MSVLDQVSKDLKDRFKEEDPMRAPDWNEENPIGLPHEQAIGLAGELDRHQASMFVMFHQYQKHHWVVEGPQFRDLHLYLEDSYNQIHKDLDAIAERLTVLGALPTASPIALAKQAYVAHEPEGYFPIRTMLRNDLKMERTICTMLRNTIGRAQEIGDYGTATLLKSVLMNAEERAHHLDHYLAEDGLRSGLSEEK